MVRSKQGRPFAALTTIGGERPVVYQQRTMQSSDAKARSQTLVTTPPLQPQRRLYPSTTSS